MANPDLPYDACLLLSFGGPEGPADVIPFLENVLRGRNVPRERMLEVAEHYQHFGGVSPINAQNRQLLQALQQEFACHGPPLPWFWGNRNWHPFLADTLREMADQGVRRALAFVTSAFSSYSGCRQYREDIAKAQAVVGEAAPVVDKLRVFYNHPGFVFAMADRVQAALRGIAADAQVRTLFTAHSIPSGMAQTSAYQRQLQEACRLVAQLAGLSRWELVYQSRSGPPQQPWLEPDVCDRIRQLKGEWGERDHLFLVPIGFISDHMEVLYDLDTEAHHLCEELQIPMSRVETVGVHPRFVAMIRELVNERLFPGTERLSCGEAGPNHDVCPVDCCVYQPTRPSVSP